MPVFKEVMKAKLELSVTRVLVKCRVILLKPKEMSHPSKNTPRPFLIAPSISMGSLLIPLPILFNHGTQSLQSPERQGCRLSNYLVLELSFQWLSHLPMAPVFCGLVSSCGIKDMESQFNAELVSAQVISFVNPFFKLSHYLLTG